MRNLVRGAGNADRADDDGIDDDGDGDAGLGAGEFTGCCGVMVDFARTLDDFKLSLVQRVDAVGIVGGDDIAKGVGNKHVVSNGQTCRLRQFFA